MLSPGTFDFAGTRSQGARTVAEQAGGKGMLQLALAAGRIRAPRRGMSVARAAVLFLLLWLGGAQSVFAACTSPLTATIPSGGQAVFTCADAGFTDIPGSGPQHGVLDTSSGIPGNIFAMTYTNNASDPATSDTFSVRDDFGTPLQVIITIIQSTPPLVISTSGVPGMTYKTAYTQTVQASGGTGQIHFTMTGQPAGIAISDAGVISGTPTQAGNFTLAVHASDSAATPQTADKSFSVTVASVAPAPPTAVAAVADTGAAGTPGNATVSFTPSADNGGAAPLSYTVTSSPGGLTASGAASPITIGNLTRGTSYTFVVRARNANNQTADSTPSAAVTPRTNDTVSIQDPGPLTFGDSPTLVATTTSNTTVTFATTTPTTCSVTAGGKVTLLQAQPCTISATSAGNAAYAPGNGTRTLTVNAGVPGAPTIGTATTTVVGDNAATGTASVTFTAPASNGGSAITDYVVSSTDGTVTAHGGASPLSVTGLTFGTAYQFRVVASNATGAGAASGTSNSVTPTKSQTITFPNPGVQNFDTTPTLVATSTSGLNVTLASQTPAICDIDAAKQLTTHAPGTCTIQATQAGNGAIQAAAPVAQSFLIQVQGGAVAIVTASLPDATFGTAYSQTIVASGGAQPYVFTSTGALPAGMTFANGTYSGTPTASGAYNVTAKVTDKAGQTDTRNYTITVNAVRAGAPTIGTVTSNDAPAGTATGSATVPFSPPSSDGGASIVSYTVTSSPGQLTATGQSPITVPGLTLGTAYTFTVHANNAAGPGPESAQGGPVTPMGAQTIAYVDTTPRNFGTTTPLTATATSGLTVAFASQTLNVCTIDGGSQVKAIAPGTCTIRASQPGSTAYRAAPTVDQSFQVVVPGGIPSFATTTLPAPTRGVNYQQTIVVAGGAPPYTFGLSGGSLPVGLTLNPSGVLSGVVRSTGPVDFTVQATDLAGQQASQRYQFTIISPAFTFTPATLPAAKVGVAYPATTIAASGGIAPYAYTVTAGTLPAGLTLSAAGVLTGTPTAASTTPVTITATDDFGVTGTQAYTIVVGEATPVAVDDSASAGANASVTVPVTTNDTGGPITSIAVTQAPAHGTVVVDGLDATYTPAHDFFGTDTFRYTGTGPGGTSNAATVTVTVAAGPVPVALAQKVTTNAGTAVTIDAANGATNGPFTTAAVSRAPASGTVVVEGTRLVYTPAADASGDITFDYTLANAFGASQPVLATVTVNPVPVAPPISTTALAGRVVQVDLTSGARGGPFTGATVISISPANAGTATVEASASGYTLTFRAASTFSGTAQLSYTLTNAFATSAPGVITIVVNPRPDPSKDPEVLGVLSAQADATRRMAVGQIGNFQRRLEMLHSGGAAGFTNGITVASAGPMRGKDAYASLRNRQDEASRRYLVQPNADGVDANAAADSQHGTLPGDVSVWTGGAVNFGKSRLGASGDGTDFTTSGLSLGVDKQFGETLALGAGVGYGHDNSDVGNHGSRSAVDSYNVALYGSFRPAASFYVDALAGYQWLSFGAYRFVTANGNRVKGERDGKQWFASLSAGYNHVGDDMQLTPYARLDVARARLDAFTEHGDDTYALDYRSQTVKTTTATVGMLAQWSAKRDYGIWAPQLRAEFGHDMQGSGSASIRYADVLDGPLYRATLFRQSRNHTLLGAGLALQTTRGWILRAEYQLQLDNTSRDNQSILLGVEKTFGP